MARKRAPKRAQKTRKRRASSVRRRKVARKSSRAGKRQKSSKVSSSPVERSITVTLEDSHLPHIEKVATILQSKGMKVDAILHKTGQITGTYSKSPATLKAIEGVLDAEESPSFQIPPPGSDPQ
jgi:7-keto-8-aminopelargonate synthetase-like enzyme